jgi:hypothetical protein
MTKAEKEVVTLRGQCELILESRNDNIMLQGYLNALEDILALPETQEAPQPVAQEELISRIFRAFGITDYPMNRKMMRELVWSAEKVVAEAKQIADAAPLDTRVEFNAGEDDHS